MFLWVAMKEVEWWLYLLMTPFVLVGLGLIAGAWQTEGRVSRIRRFVVSIVGTEKTTYTRGTTTYTDTEDFLTIVVASTEDPDQMRFGTATVTIPPDTMHSFKANNNEIVWTIRVKGEISMWPDIDEEFPFRVRPRKR